jgi:hypothetical protein
MCYEDLSTKLDISTNLVNITFVKDTTHVLWWVGKANSEGGWNNLQHRFTLWESNKYKPISQVRLFQHVCRVQKRKDPRNQEYEESFEKGGKEMAQKINNLQTFHELNSLNST